MKRVMLLVIMLPVVTLGQSAGEALQESGNAFVRRCSVVEKERDLTAVDQAYQMTCSAYVSGFVQGAVFAADFVRSRADRKGPPVYCQIEGVEAGQLVKIVLKYIREHPETAHLPAGILAGRAFQKAFPCPD